MNKKIQLFWKEFLKNLDVYIAIIAAIIFFVLGTTSKVSISIVLSSTLAILAILAYSILKNRQINEATETTLASLAKSLPDKNQMHETKERAYKFLEEYISTHYVKEAILIQHTGITCQYLLKALVRNGANVSIYIQHEETALKMGIQRPVKAIAYMSQFLRGDTGEDFNSGGKVKLYKYHVPASVHGIKLDEKVLSLGSYIYEALDSSMPNLTFPTDSARLLGSNHIPTVERVREGFTGQWRNQARRKERDHDRIEGKRRGREWVSIAPERSASQWKSILQISAMISGRFWNH